MSIYGHIAQIDARVATLVVAADDVSDLETFISTIQLQDPAVANYVEIYTSGFLDHMTQDLYKGFKHSVYAFYHTDEAQRDAFIQEWNIQLNNPTACRDRHLDMLHRKQVEYKDSIATDAERAMTLEERLGLDKYDPWDKRTDEEREEDTKMKERMKELTKQGLVSDQSFGDADELRKSRPKSPPISRTQVIEKLAENIGEDFKDQAKDLTNDQLKDMAVGLGENITEVLDDDKMPVKDEPSIHVSDIGVERNEDGSIRITNVQAHKHGGEVDTALKEARQEAFEEHVLEKKDGRKAFSPDDFAAVLAGDESSDAMGVKGIDPISRGGNMPRPSLSDHAEQARQVYQEDEKRKTKEKIRQNQREDDIKAKAERDKGIFRGADLVGDDELSWDEVPDLLKTYLEEGGLKQEAYPVKPYPYNSTVGDKYLLPFDGVLTQNGMRLIGGINHKVEGTMSIGEPTVAVVSKEISTEDAWVVYGRGRAGATVPDIWLVQLR